MAVISKTDYRLPGVYSKEVTGPKTNVTIGGNAVVALVGPAIGYSTATETLRFGTRNAATGTVSSSAALSNEGYVSGSMSLRNKATGATYEDGVDYAVSQDASSGTWSVSRVLTQLGPKSTAQAETKLTWYSAQPNVDLVADVAGKSGLYVVKGTLVVKREKTDGKYETLVEGTHYEVDYRKGILTTKVGENQIANGDKLAVSFDMTGWEPMMFYGEGAEPVSNKYVEENGLQAPTYTKAGKLTSAGVSVRLYVYKGYSSGGTKYDEFGAAAQPGAPDGYLEGRDFSVDYESGLIARLPGSAIPDCVKEPGTVVYAEFKKCSIPHDAVCTASYRYSGEGYSDAHYYANFNKFVSEMGAPWDSYGNVVSELSLTAYIANQNGIGGFYAVPVAGVTDSAGNVVYPTSSWQAAFDALTVVSGVDIVVPISGDPTIWNIAKVHCARMVENQDERCVFAGMDGTAESGGRLSVSAMEAYAQSIAANDTVLAAPSAFRFRNPMTNVIEEIPGYYVAAALAGYMSSVPQYTPLTNKTVGGIYSAAEYNTKSDKTEMCANGLAYVDEVNGAMRVLHGRSTSTDSVIDQEINITLAKYYIIKTMRRAFSSGFIGSVITGDTIATIGMTAQNVLSSLQGNGYLSSWSGLSVEQDEVNPTQVNVEFQYRPTYALEYIEISFSVDSTVA